MADDLVFPSSDPFSDFNPQTHMLNEDVLSTDLLNIPQIVPPMISPQQQQALYHSQNAHALNNATSYTPINQLMKQTEQLNTLSSSMNRNIHQGSVYNTIQNSHSMYNMNSLPNHMLQNPSNYPSPSTPNTQCLVIGGQRISIQQQTSSLQNISQTMRPMMSTQQHGIAHHMGNSNHRVPPINMNNKNVISNQVNIHNMNASNMQQSLNSPVNTSTTPNLNNIPQHLNSPINSTSSPVHIQQQVNSPLNVGLSSSTPSGVLEVKSTFNQGVNISNAASKISTALAASGLKKPDNLRGQIVKTADQRLMLITELNGKRVMYVIKPNADGQQGGSVSLENGNAIQADTSMIANTSSNNLQTINTADINTQQHISSDLSNSISDVVTSRNSPVNSPLSSPLPVLTVKNENSVVKPTTNITDRLNSKEYAMKLKEKLRNLPVDLTKLKVPGILPSVDNKSSTISANNPEFLDHSRTVQVNPVSQVVGPSVTTKTVVEIYDDEDEENGEDGQEIEFSENDIMDNEDSMDIPLNDQSNQKISSDDDDDDDDSLPLSHLKQDVPMDVGTSTDERRTSEGGDSLPLSVVAASLKKAADTSTKKKTTKSKAKKKKKDPREPVKPVRAYQVFFRDMQAEIKETEPQLTFGAMSTKIGKIWEKYDPEKKKAYQDRYATEKAAYDIKLKEYKEMIAQEAQNDVQSPITSPTPSTSADVEMASDEQETTPKKVVKRNTKKRKKPSPPKLIIETQPAEENLLAEVNDSDEIPIETIQDEPVKVKRARLKKTATNKQDENIDVPSSPSLPSSDSSSENEDEDSESTISRIRQQAADMIKQIKEEKVKEKKVVKTKKDLSKKSRATHSPRMHVETISEKEEIQAPTKKPPLERMRRIEKKSEKKSTSSSSTSSDNKVVKEKSEKLIKETIMVKNDAAPPPAASKSTFKIPKKTSSENGVAPKPSGPRLCIRENCKKPAKTTRERGSQYCSNDCLVMYCRESFDAWVLERQTDST